MVKKVPGVGEAKGVKQVSAVDSVDAVSKVDEVSAVKGVDAVRSVSGVFGAQGVGPTGQRITIHNQQEVLATIDREAEKMFEGKRIPRKRQKTITDALKMAVLASALEEEDSKK